MKAAACDAEAYIRPANCGLIATLGSGWRLVESSVARLEILPLDGIIRQWETRMAEYRAYVVGRDGHFVGWEPLVCDDDVEAIEKAKRLVEANDIELWCGERLVIHLSSTSPEPPPINSRRETNGLEQFRGSIVLI